METRSERPASSGNCRYTSRLVIHFRRPVPSAFHSNTRGGSLRAQLVFGALRSQFDRRFVRSSPNHARRGQQNSRHFRKPCFLTSIETGGRCCARVADELDTTCNWQHRGAALLGPRANSPELFVAQHGCRIHLGGASSGEVSSDQGDCRENANRPRDRQRVHSTDSVQLRCAIDMLISSKRPARSGCFDAVQL
jgi:hypothetical protein